MTNPITEKAAAVAHGRAWANPHHLKAVTREVVEARISGRGIVLIGEFRGLDMPATFRAPCGHEWQSLPQQLLYTERGCPVCARERRITRLKERGRKVKP